MSNKLTTTGPNEGNNIINKLFNSNNKGEVIAC